MYKIHRLQNHNHDDKATIVVNEDDPQWEEAIQRWREGSFPTDDPRWKLGVVACTRLITERMRK